ncbi:Uncharacterized conserved protein, DUF302 family [Arenibacter palladensis]|uniref:Uncharacterized conserved protein, DUF302 family n=2 Tax=Arenibacter TaxID=178469 RepID=A0A1X7JXT6_9FLAO|nr:MULTISPECIES: DUF302 domain-containing protein [Arenibacter]MDO6601527.1 DUF302 domain-containing protein [Arenibacter palladensis]SHE57417.1 Uncharacterized conserved protein, DUF302 family [Arenibacter palladensis]SMG33200.1 Uncharacterized conserved protein, DUF302 family [Arenibacter troitsensis]|tara:strand:- start:2832 stop:3224 length:393 start_codon:yes stop_codon:yes gene_type:complete
MEYYFNKTIGNTPFEKAVEKTKLALQEEGFGVLTEIDMKATLKKKLDVDFYNYTVLGACNAPFAHKALQAEDKIGTMLPCNVIVMEKEPGLVEIAAVNPMASMQAVINLDLMNIADEVGEKLKRVVEKIH